MVSAKNGEMLPNSDLEMCRVVSIFFSVECKTTCFIEPVIVDVVCSFFKTNFFDALHRLAFYISF